MILFSSTKTKPNSIGRREGILDVGMELYKGVEMIILVKGEGLWLGGKKVIGYTKSWGMSTKAKGGEGWAIWKGVDVDVEGIKQH